MEIFKIVSYDPIDVRNRVESIFGLDPALQIEMEGHFVHLGYESTYMISNMGSLVIINTFQVCYILLMLLLLMSKKKREWASQNLKKVFCNKALAFF